MIRHGMGVLALAGLVTIAWAQQASAQRYARSMYQPMGQAPPPAAGAPTPMQVEELPHGRPDIHNMEPGSYADPFADDSFHSGEFQPYEGYYPGVGHGEPYCEPCQSSSGSCSSGQFFATAEYLYVRASFSEAESFFEQDASEDFLTTREFNQLDFEFESSYRFGGGYRLCGCGDEIRFLYTRLRSSADEVEVPFNGNPDILILFPFEVVTPPNGETLIDADVDVKSYDFEYAKTIPLCSQSCGCGDPCGGGCGDCCAPQCPTWDITWSGGFRAAEASWERSWTSFTELDELFTGAESRMDFEGYGAKFGLEGRRYFGKTGWLSAYLKGDISLLYGQLEFESVVVDASGTGPAEVITQEFETQQIIPVTEIEAGFTAQVTCHTRLSAGYLLSAWHDLGFREDFGVDAGLSSGFLPFGYDDANILGFDGFFVRGEWAY